MNIFKSRRPWYESGLAFECTTCGRCCSGPEEGYVWITQEEITAAATGLAISDEEFIRRYARRVGKRISLIEKPNRDCIFLQNGPDGVRTCLIYAARPTQCQTWPFWSSNLMGPEAWAAAGKRCPGINCGAIRSAEHIERERQRTE